MLLLSVKILNSIFQQLGTLTLQPAYSLPSFIEEIPQYSSLVQYRRYSSTLTLFTYLLHNITDVFVLQHDGVFSSGHIHPTNSRGFNFKYIFPRFRFPSRPNLHHLPTLALVKPLGQSQKRNTIKVGYQERNSFKVKYVLILFL